MVFYGKDMNQPELQKSVLNAGLDALLIMSFGLISSAFYEEIRKKIPIIVCVTDMLTWNEHDLVTYDHMQAISLAMEHLWGKGHTRIAYIGGASALESERIGSDARCRAYMQLMRGRSPSIPDEWIVDCRWSRRVCYEKTVELITGNEKPTAILAGSDNMAAVVLKAMYDLRLHAPGDIAVIGISDLVFARYTTPPLTTVHVPVKEIGECAAELVVRRLKGDRTMKKHVLFPVSLAVREST